MLAKMKKSSLVKSSSIYTITNMINASIPFLMMPILTRHLTPVDYGIVSMFNVLVGIIYPFLGVNIHLALTRQYYEKDIKVPVYIVNGLYVLFMTIIICSASIYLLRQPISDMTSFPVEWLWSFIVVSAFNVIFQIVQTLLQVRDKPLFFGGYQILQSLLNVGLSIWLVVVMGAGWEGRIEGQVIASLICGLIGIIFLWKSGFLKFRYEKKYIDNILSLGLPLIPFGLGGFLLTMSDRVFITNMVGLDETGLYTVGYQFGMIINLIQMSFNKAWLPWLFRKLKENVKDEKIKIVKITYLYFGVLMSLAILLSFSAPWFMNIFLGEGFSASSQFVLWIAIGYAFNGMQKMVVSYIQFEKRNYLLSLITFIILGLNLPLNYYLIKSNGAVGAAQATTISYFIIFLLTWYISTKVYKMPWGYFMKKSETFGKSIEK
ncbi:lipopolysaccharide biosynthesis protein [Halalkalibacter kiskunsagensis]|uniref:Lipopolysaccharide biosynthesis protein n=1 Tax=Halalkalibacter kiskunsagensis TaxID=1548599 RepID=A0ABV6KCP2_9BACI